MKIKTCCFSLLILLIGCKSVFAFQLKPVPGGKAHQMLLAEALKLIGDHYQVNFLYEESVIGNKLVFFSADGFKGKKIDPVLSTLLLPAGLSWTKIDARNFSIFPVKHKAVIKEESSLPQNLIELDSVGNASDRFAVKAALNGLTLKEVRIITHQPSLQRKGDRYILNLENSIIAEGASMLEMMNKLPGVQVGADGRLTVNGRSGINIMVDGKSMILSASDLDAMLTAGIEKIELITNPSAKYESAGSAGVINIIRKRNHKDGLNGNAGIGYGRGEYDRANGSFNLSFRNTKYNLFINGSSIIDKTYINANAVSEFYNQNIKTGELDAHNFHVKNSSSFIPVVGLELYLSPKTMLTLSGSGQLQTAKNRSDSFTDVFNQDNVQLNRLGFTNNEKDPVHNYSSSAQITHQLDTNGREFSMDLDYSNYQHSSDQDITNTVMDPNGTYISGVPFYLDQHNKLNIYAVKADYVQPLKDKSKLEFGAKSSYVDSKSFSNFYGVINGVQYLDLSRSNYFKYAENINAVYVNYNREVNKVSYQAGLRMEQTDGDGNQLLTTQLFKQNYTQLFPSLALKYKINDQQSITFSSGRKIDRPAYLDLNPLLSYVNATAYLQGDPNLKPQVVYNNELSYSYNNTFFVTIGHSFYRNYITYWVFPEKGIQNQVDDVVVSRPVNIAKAVSYNANLLYIKKLNRWWTMNNNLTLYYNLYNGMVNNYEIRNQGRPSFMVSANQAFSITNKISAEANFRYSGKSQDGTSVYKPNSNLSLGVKTSLMADRASLAFNVTDVFHDQNYIWVSNTGSIVESREVKIDSRVLKLNFSYRFGRTTAKGMKPGTGADEEKNRARRN